MAKSQPLFLVAGVKRLGWDLLLLLLVELVLFPVLGVGLLLVPQTDPVHNFRLLSGVDERLLIELLSVNRPLDVGLPLEVLLTLLDIDYLLLDLIVGGGPVLLEEYLPTLKDSYESEIKSRLNLACLE